MAGTVPFCAAERMLAWRYLRAKRSQGGVSLISIISFVGIMLAVMALIVVMSIMNGFRSTLLDALLGGQGHVFVQIVDQPADEIDLLSDRIAAIEGVSSASPMIEEQVLASTDYAKIGAAVRGVRLSDLDNLPFLENGAEKARQDGFGAGRNGGNLIYIGRFLASDLGVLPGDRLTLIAPEGTKGPFGVTPRRKTYIVADTFETGSVELDKLYILMPMVQSQLFFNLPATYEFIDVRLDDPLATEPSKQAIAELTAGRFLIDDWKRQRASYLGALNAERSMMRLVMLILITITALNIITGVVMLVKNKTRDIAILRTIGASRGALMRVFIMIGAILGLTGAFFGLTLGVAIVLNISAVEAFISFIIGREIFPPDVYGLQGLPAELDWSEAIFTPLWAMAMSVLVTIWPAWSAAKLDPVEALRFG